MSNNGKGTPQVIFRAGNGFLREQLEARSPEHEDTTNLVAKRDLTRYYDALDRALHTVDLSEAEASAICDANNGTFWADDEAGMAGTQTMLWANVADTPGLSEKWGIDQDALIAKMRGWSHIQALAVIDACERFWARYQTSTVQSVGLVR